MSRCGDGGCGEGAAWGAGSAAAQPKTWRTAPLCPIMHGWLPLLVPVWLPHWTLAGGGLCMIVWPGHRGASSAALRAFYNQLTRDLSSVTYLRGANCARARGPPCQQLNTLPARPVAIVILAGARADSSPPTPHGASRSRPRPGRTPFPHVCRRLARRDARNNPSPHPGATRCRRHRGRGR